jgi:FMN-dependent NADH-azoreductase
MRKLYQVNLDEAGIRAEKILIAVPFWDLSFPALLKVYLEWVCGRSDLRQYGGRKKCGISSGKAAGRKEKLPARRREHMYP